MRKTTMAALAALVMGAAPAAQAGSYAEAAASKLALGVGSIAYAVPEAVVIQPVSWAIEAERNERSATGAVLTGLLMAVPTAGTRVLLGAWDVVTFPIASGSNVREWRPAVVSRPSARLLRD